jgi:Mrp family chromosome partitioning ATPase
VSAPRPLRGSYALELGDVNLAFFSISRMWRRAALESAICAAMVAGTRLLALRLAQGDAPAVRDPLLIAAWPAFFAACGWFVLRGLRPRSRAAVSDDVIADITSQWISPPRAAKTIPSSQQVTVRIAPSLAPLDAFPALRAMRAREPTERIVSPPPAARERPRPSARPDQGALPTRVIYYVSTQLWSADPNVVNARTSAQLCELCDALQALRNSGCRTVRIASASNSRYAKSQIAAQLAIMLAEQPDTQVLLMEADLDAPALHHVLRLSVPRGLGLSEQLQRLGAPVQPLDAVTIMRLSPALHVLIESRWGSPSLFESPQFAEIVKQQRSQHDLIVIDGPIVDTFSDATALAGAVDHVVFVVASGTRLPDALALANKHFAKESMLKVIRTGDWPED